METRRTRCSRWPLLGLALVILLVPAVASAQSGAAGQLLLRLFGIHAVAPQGPRPAPEPINLNTASQQELQSLPGISWATARKIVAKRPYAAIEELARADVPAPTIERITPLVTVEAVTASTIARSAPAGR